MRTQLLVTGGLLGAIAALVFTFSRTVKKYDAQKEANRKKTGRRKYVK